MVSNHLLTQKVARQTVASLVHGGHRCAAGRDAYQIEMPEHRQSAAVERGRKGGAAGVGDLGALEVELLELRQHSCRRRWRWRHEGGEALVAERVASESETL
eukprot:scaffold53793_cov65-Phaeocystis_antarctica.AAC.4